MGEAAARLFPTEIRFSSRDYLQPPSFRQLIRRTMQPQFEGVKIVTAESSLEDAAKLIVVRSYFQFLGGPTDGEVVDEDLPLVDSALSDPADFAKLEVVEMLHTHPNPGAQHRENQAERTARRTQEKKAEQGEHRGHGVKHDDYLAVRKTALQEFVMNVLAVRGKHGPTADEAPHHRKGSLEDGQAERNHGDSNGNDGRRFLGPL